MGHFSKECKVKNNDNNMIATLKKINTDVINCYMKTFVDSGSSCHTVTDLRLLNHETIEETKEIIKSANGSIIWLTHMGERTINTGMGVLKLSKVYYGKDLKYNLLCVPELNKKGANVVLGEKHAHIEKNGKKIELDMCDGLWALPIIPENNTVATLRMELGGGADAETWHRRLGHIGDRKRDQLVREGSVPRLVKEFNRIIKSVLKIYIVVFWDNADFAC